jgi:hypothetical protein
VLWVPVSGARGSGEAQAALLLLSAWRERRPALRAELLLARESALSESREVPIHLLDATASKASAAVIERIRMRRPRIVVFDSNSRYAQLNAAKSCGAIVVFLNWRASSRRRALAWRKLGLIDHFWQLFPTALDTPPSWWQRFKLGRARFRIEDLGTPAPPPDHAAARALLPPDGSEFVLLTPSGAYAVDAFRALADTLVARGMRVVLSVSAPPRAPTHPGLIELERLPAATLLGLIDLATRVVVNGGGLLLQTIALGHAPIAVPLTRDQPARVARLEALSLCVAVAPEQLLARAPQLLDADVLRDRTQVQIQAEALGIRNGLAPIVARLEALLASSA